MATSLSMRCRSVVEEFFSVDISERSSVRATHFDPRAIYYLLCIEMWGSTDICIESGPLIDRHRASAYNVWKKRDMYFNDKRFLSNYRVCKAIFIERHLSEFNINRGDIDLSREEVIKFRDYLLISHLKKLSSALVFMNEKAAGGPLRKLHLEELRKAIDSFCNLETPHGLMEFNETTSKIFDQLKIVDPYTWDR